MCCAAKFFWYLFFMIMFIILFFTCYGMLVVVVGPNIQAGPLIVNASKRLLHTEAVMIPGSSSEHDTLSV